MNTTTLKKAFKEVYGVSIAVHMKKHRMERAAKLLRETPDNISEIARSVGYESQSRFTTAFKDTYGVLPTEYRRNSLQR
ncbi:MAG: AraC family transcriptional regulator [Lachnospiraceae bacterium]|nr:AraC family transcriptional regulator [Lachnospiraceae bacterium]